MKEKLNEVLKHKVIILIFTLVLVILLFFIWTRSIRLEINDLEASIKSMEKNIISQVQTINTTTTEVATDKEPLSGLFEHEMGEYNPSTNTIDVSFKVIPTKLTKNLKVSLIINGKETNLKREGVMFSKDIQLRLDDPFKVFIVFAEGTETKIEKTNESYTELLVGDWALPRLDLDIDHNKVTYEAGNYSLYSVLNMKLKESENQKKITSLEYIFEVDGEIRQQDVIEMPATLAQDLNIEISTKEEFTEEQKAQAYIKATDEYGLVHKAYLNLQPEEYEFSQVENPTKVFSDTGEELFEYSY